MGILKKIRDFFSKSKKSDINHSSKEGETPYPPYIPLEKKPPVKHITFNRNEMLAKKSESPIAPVKPTKALRKTQGFYGPDGKLHSD